MERPKSRFRQASWRLCNCLMSTFFALATYVQMNDPDAGLWMVAYAVPAGLCFLVCLKSTITETSLWRRLADLHVLVSTTFGTMLGWTLYRDNITNIFQQEEGREFGGLLLTVVWLLLCRHSGRDKESSRWLKTTGCPRSWLSWRHKERQLE
uniref:Transmembrane protein 220 n=1 Tax=Denticeps clupeoides TaxID=299321 RepID=A0AAY4C7A7_9TELE